MDAETLTVDVVENGRGVTYLVRNEYGIVKLMRLATNTRRDRQEVEAQIRAWAAARGVMLEWKRAK